jgi:hypothetical protein
MKKGDETFEKAGDELPLMTKGNRLIESSYEPVYSHNIVPPWEVQTRSRCIMPKSTRIL